MDAQARTWFCEANGVDSEWAFKVRARDAGEITWHAHLGLSDWAATADALRQIHDELAADGAAVHRFGLCLSRAMSLPAGAERDAFPKETGPLLHEADWARIGRAAPIQPHLGDHMIGTPAAIDNVRAALAAGITTIGNLSQYLAFDLPGLDARALARTTVEAIRLVAAHPGGLVHSYLDDGPAVQLDHLGSYLGWAALERWVVEERCAAPLTHCYGGLVPDPFQRLVAAFALAELDPRRTPGSMVYGDTVSYVAEPSANEGALVRSVEADVLAQLVCPTGHAVNPVPLTEAQRIPSADEVVHVHRIAREVERRVRADYRAGHHDELVGEARRVAALAAAHARRFRDGAIVYLASLGVDTGDAVAVLGALRDIAPADLERRLALDALPAVAALRTWKSQLVGELAAGLRRSLPRLDGRRVALAVLEVHDVVRDSLAHVLPERGAEVVLLPKDATPAGVAAAAADEDCDTVIVGTYNGGAATLADGLLGELARRHHEPLVLFGGIINEDRGGPVPVDVRSELSSRGIRCVERLDDLATLLAARN